jgi:catechol 2,3-dioxygenase-like lactoylglutathione lyase family enzyme
MLRCRSAHIASTRDGTVRRTRGRSEIPGGLIATPPIAGILETVLYYRDQGETERFYSEVLGLRLIGKAPGRHLFYRAGSSLLLLFDPASTDTTQGSLPAHGAAGSVHVCLLAPAEGYQSWKEYLPAQDVEIIQESRWSDQGQSFYFRDPTGNLLEIANTDFWPR